MFVPRAHRSTFSSLSNGEAGSRAPLYHHALFPLHALFYNQVLQGRERGIGITQSALLQFPFNSLPHVHSHTQTRARLHKLRIVYRPPCIRKRTRTHARAARALS